ncbi:probable glycosyltransferase At5g03795 [Tripterygium wilfordii]|uniref:probable glycosyltransferase At5g03795 n=1 Tax=Tripterygium wilfordii TaxID=458696 RepID=UPI0018F8621C|nr:probable glycosyltransferase At5g03795 [Tripterygium wilfordii]
MPSCVNFFFIISVSVAISAVFLYSSPLSGIASTTTNDQVNTPVQDSGIFEEVFQYPDVFLRNYALMEKGFKIFIYEKTEDEAFVYNEKYMPKGVPTEVVFTHLLSVSKRFRTYDDTQAHMFFIQLTWLDLRSSMGSYASAENFIRQIMNEYPHWNRSKGVDHFLVTCCYAGAKFSEIVPLNNSIRVSCLARNDSRHDIHHKHHHITIPQMRRPHAPPALGIDIDDRTILAFWAGPKISPASESDWYEYINKFMTSKYCICDGASYVTRICITDSIHFGCVPVILNEDYELPFGDILHWRKFSVIINKDNAHQVEQILEAISDSKFSELHSNLLKVQRHFYSDLKGHKPYDAFHMIMYELWLRHLARSFSDS